MTYNNEMNNNNNSSSISWPYTDPTCPVCEGYGAYATQDHVELCPLCCAEEGYSPYDELPECGGAGCDGSCETCGEIRRRRREGEEDEATARQRWISCSKHEVGNEPCRTWGQGQGPPTDCPESGDELPF